MMLCNDRDLAMAAQGGSVTPECAARPGHLFHRVILAGFLAACSHDDRGAQPGDATPASDAPSAPVTLTVTKDGQPMAGVHTYFLNADNSPAATVDTDGTGTAQASMPGGGSVTVIDPFGVPTDADQLTTIMGVKPGDHLMMGKRTGDLFITMRVPLVATAGGYDVFTTCGTGSLGRGNGIANPSGSVGLFACNGTADIAVVAHSQQTPSGTTTPISGLFHAGAAVVADGLVDLSTDSYAALTDLTFTYVNAPSAQIAVEHAPVLPHGLLGPFSTQVDAGTATLHEPMLPSGRSVVTSRVVIGGEHTVVENVPDATGYRLDLNGVLLPDVPARPTFDIATGRVVWTESDTGATPDLAVNFISALRTGASSRGWQWAIMAPYKRGEIAFPRLPTDVFDWTPTAGDQVSVEEVTIAKFTGGYDAIRARALADSQISVGPGERLVSATSPH